MRYLLLVLVILAVVSCKPQQNEGINGNEAEATNFLQRYEIDASLVCNHVMEASWNYHTNITEFNKRVMLLRQLQGSAFRRQKWEEASQFRWRTFSNAGVRRLFSFATVLGSAALPDNDRLEYTQLLQELKTDYTQVRICPYNPQRIILHSSTDPTTSMKFDNDNKIDVNRNQSTIGRNECIPTLRLEPDLIRIMAESRNPKELQYIWRAWRDKTGRPQKQKFLRFVKLSNKAARLNGFNDTADFWQQEYESEFLEKDLSKIWEQLRPMYEQLHSYVRRKLAERYGKENINGYGTIPAHLLGNMWGQSWSNLLDLAIPYPGRSFMNVTHAMKQQGYSPLKIFRMAEEFFTSLGLDPMPRDFYRKSMLQKPNDREVICHASSWDFCNGRDYRISQCTRITMSDFLTAHHEMGHVHYAMNYRNLPLLFRDGANPGFHEAVGDAIGLSASTSSHMSQVGLMIPLQNLYEDDINFLFGIALDKIAFLPFAYIVDQWRWKIFREEIPEADMNRAWWKLRVQFQGISPPEYRSENDFDPGAKYHVAANIPYMRYFVGHILQFQIHEELCRVSGYTGPLHQCDIYRSKAAGSRLRRMMQLGKSYPWPLALSALTDGRTQELDAGPLLRYFSNLTEWLERQNRADSIGWSSSAAIAALQGGTVQVASSNIIGLVIGLIALVIIMICLTIVCHKKLKKEISSNEIQREITRASIRNPSTSIHSHSAAK